MVDFIQQNWVGILLVGAMLAMHLGGHPWAGPTLQLERIEPES